jgi:hypothetical protein
MLGLPWLGSLSRLGDAWTRRVCLHTLASSLGSWPAAAPSYRNSSNFAGALWSRKDRRPPAPTGDLPGPMRVRANRRCVGAGAGRLGLNS